MEKNITVYSASWCGPCKYAKDLLKEKNLPFKEIDIEKEGINREDLFKLTGGRTIPQIIIDDEKNDYVITVDVARGVGEDYSAFVIFDITEFPHKIVAKYRKNDIKPMLFPNVIWEMAKLYNEAFILADYDQIIEKLQFATHC